ncbi:DUF2058 domain-containing protein [Teredinibacter purpureus]|uniref:DUF2058 domain-containing protein n=1 Tax=Teredinibacter purpureus TaxID=2731756 RepID=UPI0005F7AE01|nr:DUF2058 domain-containing protein [Teredinibacter purpureus]
MSSLQDQLLNAGLVNEKTAKKAKKDKAKKKRVDRKSSQPIIDETKEQAKKVLAEKTERDRQLNAERNAKAQQKAILAQIRQLITTNAIRRDGDIAFNFSDGKLIKKIYINGKLQDQLSRGQIAVVRLDEGYELVPAVIAEKISQRDDGAIISLAERNNTIEDDDPYADYQIPDDLMW